MQDNSMYYLIILAMLVVFAILLTGIGGFAKGGEFNRRNANKIMRWRIIAQAVAIALIMTLIWLRGR
ncbi:twin transmembrane helix small protein [Paracoccus fistulariae]|uniref:Twin transmembrane helix small protein n=2 Tax=Paracoccus fistulariae TaxID=658446 RepID=A0ABY7SIP9_9RHOB|nr:twin transmembrane helix small protein [Paracoccus fistulariae]MDB6181947.1 twin transmembrane helix small protein [Paracoccus fistulariae]WCR06813.1 twin transmembrane helix small protein [Paracoccus fistulariae]